MLFYLDIKSHFFVKTKCIKNADPSNKEHFRENSNTQETGSIENNSKIKTFKENYRKFI